jgi:solute carrier family 39 (zinc transporter), member 1/2/3
MELARLVLRQDLPGAEASTDEEVTCEGANGYDGRMGVRISAIFVILVGSLFGKLAITTAFASMRAPHVVDTY